MVDEFIIPEANRVHIAWDDALLRSTDRQDLAFSLPANVDRLFEELEASGKKKIVIYAHGGLVSSQAELGQGAYHQNPENKVLFNALDRKGVYPIYFVWETGMKESIRAAAKDLGEEIVENPLRFLKAQMAELVQTLLFKKITRYLPKILASKARPRGGMGLAEPPVIEDVEIEQNLNKLSFYDPSKVDYDEFDEQDKEQFLEKLSSDEEFMTYLKELAGKDGMGLAESQDARTLNTNAGELMQTLRDDFETVSPGEPVQVSLVERPGTGLAPIIVLKSFAEALGQLVFAVGGRFIRNEDHGFVATITEEFFRLTKLNLLGILIWRQMKLNAEKAYIPESVDGIPHGGYYVITKLAEYLIKHPETKVSLIGHSAGSIHLSHFIEAADLYFNQSESDTLKDFQFSNVIFLAPAVNFETFQKVVSHRRRFARCDIFTMKEADEMQDALLAGFSKNPAIDKFLSGIYPCSLLYAVSGIAEDIGKGDVPLLGLARHLDQATYRGTEALVLNSHSAMAQWPININWSHNNPAQLINEGDIERLAGAGQFSAALKHGDFDSEPWTAMSVAALL
jgi:hypothetical protein